MRTLALVDGEHYPPVTRWGIEVARAPRLRRDRRRVRRRDREALRRAPPGSGRAAPRRGRGPYGGRRGRDRRARAPTLVLDLSDEPVLGYRERMAVAAEALARGVPYVGPDFRLDPPERLAPPPGTPTLAVFGTGKRTGKTAVAGEVARVAARRGLAPVVVAMGRGGPPEPQVAEAGSVHARAAPRARPVGRACRLRLPGGCAHDRRHDDRRPPGGGRPRGRALRQQRPRGAAARRRSRPRGRDPRGQRCLAATDRLGRRRHRRAGDLPGGVRPRLPGSVPALAGGSCRGYHGWRTGSRNGERLPPRRASPGFPRRCSGRGHRFPADAARRRRRAPSLLRHHRAARRGRAPGRTSAQRARRRDRRLVVSAR